MRRLLASLFLGFSLLTLAAPAVLAEDSKTTEDKGRGNPVREAPTSSSSFDVFEIFDTSNNKGETTVGADNLTESTFETAERENVSPLAAVILRAINILSLVVGTFAFVVILIGGIMLITAGGNDAQIDKAKGVIPQALLGLGLAFGSYFIVTFLLSFFY